MSSNAQFDWLDSIPVKSLLHAFSAAGVELRFVGGAVRDSLLGLPVYDKDAATPATPDQVIAICEKAGIRTIPTGIAHGTITARIDNENIEITTLRRDTACDGRHATVEFGESWEEDARRRDFTINALYVDAAGKIYDYNNGLEDIKTYAIRFIGSPDERIKEDYLRILRFFRFLATRGNLPADAAALSACTKHASQLETLSGERIKMEMFKLLTATDPIPSLDLMGESNIFPVLFSQSTDISIAAKQEIIFQKWELPAKPLYRLAGLLIAAQNPSVATRFVMDRWKLSRREQEELSFLITQSANELEIMNERAQKEFLRKFSAQPVAGAIALRGAVNNARTLQNFYQLSQNWNAPHLPVTGRDLLEMGLTEGRELGEKLKMLEEKWVASDYRITREELLKHFNFQ